MANFIDSLSQSGIRSMTVKCENLGGVNLGQGICDILTSKHIRSAASEAIEAGYNTYAPYQGIFQLRELLLKKLSDYNQILAPSLDNILVTHGSTGGFVSALKAIFDQREENEAILFEPFYGYHRQLLELHGVSIKTVLMDVNNEFQFDLYDIEKVISKKSKAIIICNPSNPSGKVFTREELKKIGDIAIKHNLYIISDEIYEHIVYPPQHQHISIASMSDYSERVIMLSGFSKTYHMTGWRVGYAYGPSNIIKKMGLIHDLLYICAPTPLQHGVIAALQLPKQYYEDLTAAFLNKKLTIVKALRDIGFTLVEPQGAYYLIADYSNLNLPKDSGLAANVLLENARVSTVPAKYFYLNEKASENKLRFCFAVSDQKINKAMEQLNKYFHH